MSTDQFNPRLRRVLSSFDRSGSYEPLVLGNPDGDVLLQLFINPLSAACREFFSDEFDVTRQVVEGMGSVRVELRPIAPVMRMRVTGISYDVQRGMNQYRLSDKFSPVDFAEFVHALREEVSDEDVIRTIQRGCEAKESVLTFERLEIFAEDVGVDDGSKLLTEIEQGTHRGRVRRDSELWFRLLRGERQRRSPEDTIIFVNGSETQTYTATAISRHLTSVERVRGIDNGISEE